MLVGESAGVRDLLCSVCESAAWCKSQRCSGLRESSKGVALHPNKLPNGDERDGGERCGGREAPTSHAVRTGTRYRICVRDTPEPKREATRERERENKSFTAERCGANMVCARHRRRW